MPGALKAEAPKVAPAGHHKNPFNAAAADIDWEMLIDQLPFGLIVLSPQQTVRHESDRCRKMLGLSVKESGGVEPWLSALCPDKEHTEKVIKSWREHIWRNQLRRTFTLRGTDQKLREIEFRSSLQGDGGITLTIQDVTHVRRMDETLRHGRLKFRVLFSQSRVGTILVDRTGRIIDANMAFTKLTGFPMKSLRLKAFSELLNPADAEKLAREEHSFLENQDLSETASFTDSVHLKSESGEIIQTPITYCPVGENTSAPSMSIYLFSAHSAGTSGPDPELARQLKVVSQKAQALLNAVPDLILLLDHSGSVIDFAPPPEPWAEHQPDESWPGEPLELLWPALDLLFQNSHAQVVGDGKTVHAEIHGRTEQSLDHSVSISPCGSDQVLAVIRQTPAKAKPVAENAKMDHEWAQHQFRNQIQLVTSLFSLEPQDAAGHAAFQKWQVRLRSIAQACPSMESSRVWITPLLRSIADEVCSLSGRGSSRREVIVTGSDIHAVAPTAATSLSLLAGEFMRLVLNREHRGSGPEIYFDIHQSESNDLHLTIRLGEGRTLSFTDEASEVETLEILAEQMQGTLQKPVAEAPESEWILILPSGVVSTR